MSNLKVKAVAAACAGCVAVSGFFLSQRSEQTIAPITPAMQAVVRCAIQHTTVDFTAYHGLRTDAEQRDMIARGVSWVNRSRHQDGDAVDVMAVVNGKGSWEPKYYIQMAPAFYYCGEKLGTPVTWGGEWRVKDYVHFERKR